MCQSHSTIGPGGDFTTLDAWVDALQSWAWGADGRCIAGANLGNFAPPPLCNTYYWQLEPASDADRHTSQWNTGAYGEDLSVVDAAMTINVTGIRFAGNAGVSSYDRSVTAIFDGVSLSNPLAATAGSYSTVDLTLRNHMGFGVVGQPLIGVSTSDSGCVTLAIENGTIYGSNTAATGLIRLDVGGDGYGLITARIVNTLAINRSPESGGTPGPIFVIGTPDRITVTGDSNIDNDPGPNPMPGSEGEIEIRPVMEADDLGESLTPELRDQEARLRGQVAPAS